MIYLDNNATTFLDPRVADKLSRLLCTHLGNPSSVHRVGQEAKQMLFEAWKNIADHWGVKQSEVIFTSGATEALNMLIQGFPCPTHIITSSLEHPAVLAPLARLEKRGVQITYLQPAVGKGKIEVAQVEEAITAQTSLIILAAANSETGIKNPIHQIALLAAKHDIALLIDAVALVGKEPFSLPEGRVALCFSSHKMHGPLGCAVAVVRKGFPCEPLLLGGPQQLGKRAGTENLLAIAGCAHALALLKEELPRATEHMRFLQKTFEEGLSRALPSIVVIGQAEERLVNTSCVAFPGSDGESLVTTLDLAGLAASHGAACSSGTLEASRILLNMHLPPPLARSAIRFSLSRFTTINEITQAIDIVTHTII